MPISTEATHVNDGNIAVVQSLALRLEEVVHLVSRRETSRA